ncbi:MAG: site-2 protease family protein [Gammaproteobacteria bacterium]|jgi:Zn-dependent protease
MGELSKIQFLAVAALPILFAITVHEVAHGWVAKRLGDPTAMMMGRLTLNPIKHIDPVGTVLLPVLMLWTTGFLFGWAKPVPITWENLRNPKRDMGVVALAGPAANFIMVFIWALVLKLASLLPHSASTVGIPLVYMGFAGIFINTVLMALNLIPIPPLDGGRIASSLLPNRLSAKFNRLEPFGLLILVVLLITGVLGSILMPAINIMMTIASFVFGIDPNLLMTLGS